MWSQSLLLYFTQSQLKGTTFSIIVIPKGKFSLAQTSAVFPSSQYSSHDAPAEPCPRLNHSLLASAGQAERRHPGVPAQILWQGTRLPVRSQAHRSLTDTKWPLTVPCRVQTWTVQWAFTARPTQRPSTLWFLAPSTPSRSELETSAAMGPTATPSTSPHCLWVWWFSIARPIFY